MSRIKYIYIYTYICLYIIDIYTNVDACVVQEEATLKLDYASFLPFEEALVHARSLGLGTQEAWREWCESGARPNDVPAWPDDVYSEEGWQTWGHWLGTAAHPPFPDTTRTAVPTSSLAATPAAAHSPCPTTTPSLEPCTLQHAPNQYQSSQHVQLQHRKFQTRHGYASHSACPAGLAFARVKEEAKVVRANVPATRQTTQKPPAKSEQERGNNSITPVACSATPATPTQSPSMDQTLWDQNPPRNGNGEWNEWVYNLTASDLRHAPYVVYGFNTLAKYPWRMERIGLNIHGITVTVCPYYARS